MLNTTRRKTLYALLGLAAFSISAAPALAQNSSLMQRHSGAGNPRPLTIESNSLLFQQAEPPKVMQLHDIVTIVVNMNSRLLSEGELENRKRANFDAQLQDWIRLSGFGVAPDPQSEGDPRIRGQFNSQFRSESGLELRNALTFTIAAMVVDVRPNGNLVIEARQTFRINEEIWEQSLNGVIRREDVTPDNKVESEDVAELRVHKRELGQVRDGYRRGWFQRLYERFQPF